MPSLYLHLIPALLLLYSFIPTSYTLECWSCEGKCGCRSPTLEACAPHTKCYTISSLAGTQVLKKGCSLDCLDVDVFNQNCLTCRGDLCNSEQTPVPTGATDECGPVEGTDPTRFPQIQPQIRSRGARDGYELGQGVRVMDRSPYELGHGVTYNSPQPPSVPLYPQQPSTQQVHSSNSFLSPREVSGGPPQGYGVDAHRSTYDELVAMNSQPSRNSYSGGLGNGVSVGNNDAHRNGYPTPQQPHSPRVYFDPALGRGVHYNGSPGAFSVREKVVAVVSLLALLAFSCVLSSVI